MDEHNCTANLSTNEDEIIVSGGEVYVYRTCKICGDEFKTLYEYVETVPTN
jgi:hypothetical protein